MKKEYVFIFRNGSNSCFPIKSFGNDEEEALEKLYSRKKGLRNLDLQEVFLRDKSTLTAL